MTPTADELVAEFGESHRRLIEDSLAWLDGRPWEADLDRREFVRDLIDRARPDGTEGKDA